MRREAAGADGGGPSSARDGYSAAVSGDTVHEYQLQRPWFSFLGARCRVLDERGQPLLFARRRPLRLREDVRAFQDEGETREVLRIHTEQVLDLGATYQVTDSLENVPVGGLRRRFLRSMVRDEWTLLDPSGLEIGRVREDNAALALLRRVLTNLIPQTYVIEAGGVRVGEVRQRFNPFLFRAVMRLGPGAEERLDRRLVFGLAILLMVIEGRQES